MSDEFKKSGSANRPAEQLLPPHNEQAEQAVLGCIFYDGAAVVPKIAEKIGEETGVFYDLKHDEIWNVARYLYSKGKLVDIITVQAELKNRQMLDQIGGIPYLAKCQDQIAGASFLEEYLQIVWEKYVARRVIQKNVEVARHLMEFGGDMSEALIAREEERSTEFRRLLERGTVTPKHLARVSDFQEQYFNLWFNPKIRDEFGYEMPFPFPLRFRPGEMTLMTGDSGSGKSSFLGQIYIKIAKQFEGKKKVVIASFEVAPEITLWMMARQLLGTGTLVDDDEGRRQAANALAWLHERVLFYNFLGIADWREVVNTFEYAAAHEEGEIFGVDSVMRIGIQDDDYTTQGLAAARFADFAVKRKKHVFLVVHENKGAGAQSKDKVRGSKQWTDNSHNICGMLRNQRKAVKVDELNEKLTVGEISEPEHETQMQKLRADFDAKFLLHKQRWPGAQQNGSRWLWFDKASLQLLTHPDDAPTNYLKQKS